jgi:hypothetical protein
VIEDGLVDDWPEDVLTAMRRFEQGDLVANPPFFYVASPRHAVWQFTRDVGDPDLADELLEVDPEDSPRYGMITTETCDLVEEDRRPRQPWFSVAPVYEIVDQLDENAKDLLDQDRVEYLRKLPTSAQTSGLWVVDCRIEMPLEKSWLVGKDPIQLFNDDASRSGIADFLAKRRKRPVLSDALHKSLITPVRRWVERLSVARRGVVLDGVAELRLIVAGSPMNPDGAGLILIAKGKEFPPATREDWERKWEGWRERTEQVGIALLATAFENYDSLSARQYRESFPISLEFATRQPEVAP